MQKPTRNEFIEVIEVNEITPKGEYALNLLLSSDLSLDEIEQLADAMFSDPYTKRIAN